MKIRINTNKNCYITPILKALRSAGAHVVDTRSIPKYSIILSFLILCHASFHVRPTVSKFGFGFRERRIKHMFNEEYC